MHDDPKHNGNTTESLRDLREPMEIESAYLILSAAYAAGEQSGLSAKELRQVKRLADVLCWVQGHSHRTRTADLIAKVCEAGKKNGIIACAPDSEEFERVRSELQSRFSPVDMAGIMKQFPSLGHYMKYCREKARKDLDRIGPPASGACDKCGKKHGKNTPHESTERLLHVTVLAKCHPPNWEDMLADCNERVQRLVMAALVKIGAWPNRVELSKQELGNIGSVINATKSKSG